MEPKVSVLCVTKNRPEFMPWLAWNFSKQTYKNKELIVVDASEPGNLDWVFGHEEQIHVLPRPGMTHTVQTTCAVQRASGEFYVWFDDDDWQHPDRLARSVAAIGDEPFAGWCRGYFLDLHTNLVSKYQSVLYPIHTLSVFRTEACREIPYTHDGNGFECYWMRDLFRRHGKRHTINLDAMSVWLRHGKNVSGTSRWQANLSIEVLRSEFGAAWDGTEERLLSLRASLTPPATLQAACHGF